ncbi:thioredoxin family protein [Aneurinibacillus thermoaerophilus]|uniref:thioredoxin family protein n=1 Tax=Aneurinibacillus thermoaerophilus TaxID=143495 RepID=UPI002E20470D|nr:thioredoxin family protein [Aneurinibacillus thermoaerophilus]
MSHKIHLINLFTLTACPMGRSMGDVLFEISEHYEDIQTKIIYVELNTEATNFYRIKKNPTLLFLSNERKEIARLEGFHETEEVKNLIDQINQNNLNISIAYDENQVSSETYTIYLYKDNNIAPIEINYQYPTSVKAPRITIINLLLKANIDGYYNTFFIMLHCNLFDLHARKDIYPLIWIANLIISSV